MSGFGQAIGLAILLDDGSAREMRRAEEWRRLHARPDALPAADPAASVGERRVRLPLLSIARRLLVRAG